MSVSESQARLNKMLAKKMQTDQQAASNAAIKRINTGDNTLYKTLGGNTDVLANVMEKFADKQHVIKGIEADNGQTIVQEAIDKLSDGALDKVLPGLLVGETIGKLEKDVTLVEKARDTILDSLKKMKQAKEDGELGKVESEKNNLVNSVEDIIEAAKSANKSSGTVVSKAVGAKIKEAVAKLMAAEGQTQIFILKAEEHVAAAKKDAKVFKDVAEKVALVKKAEAAAKAAFNDAQDEAEKGDVNLTKSAADKVDNALQAAKAALQAANNGVGKMVSKKLIAKAGIKINEAKFDIVRIEGLKNEADQAKTDAESVNTVNLKAADIVKAHTDAENALKDARKMAEEGEVNLTKSAAEKVDNALKAAEIALDTAEKAADTVKFATVTKAISGVRTNIRKIEGFKTEAAAAVNKVQLETALVQEVESNILVIAQAKAAAEAASKKANDKANEGDVAGTQAEAGVVSGEFSKAEQALQAAKAVGKVSSTILTTKVDNLIAGAEATAKAIEEFEAGATKAAKQVTADIGFLKVVKHSLELFNQAKIDAKAAHDQAKVKAEAGDDKATVTEAGKAKTALTEAQKALDSANDAAKEVISTTLLNTAKQDIVNAEAEKAQIEGFEAGAAKAVKQVTADINSCEQVADKLLSAKTSGGKLKEDICTLCENTTGNVNVLEKADQFSGIKTNNISIKDEINSAKAFADQINSITLKSQAEGSFTHVTQELNELDSLIQSFSFEIYNNHVFCQPMPVFCD